MNMILKKERKKTLTQPTTSFLLQDKNRLSLHPLSNDIKNKLNHHKSMRR